MQNIFVFHPYFVVRDDLTMKIDQFKFIIVTLLNGNYVVLIGELHSCTVSSKHLFQKVTDETGQ